MLGWKAENKEHPPPLKAKNLIHPQEKEYNQRRLKALVSLKLSIDSCQRICDYNAL